MKVPFKNNMFVLILDRAGGGEEKERERGIDAETLIGCFLYTLYWGSSPQGIKRMTSWCVGQCSTSELYRLGHESPF